jgi:predicted PurR-regulated permease PerM
MESQPLYYRLTVKLFLLVLVVYVLSVARDLLIPFTIAMLLTFLLLPLSERMEKIGLPRWLSIIITILLAILVFGSLIYFFVSQVISFREDIPLIRQQVALKGERLLSYVESTLHISQEKQMAWLKGKVTETASGSDTVIFSIFSTTGTLIASLALIPIYIFFLTYLREKYRTFITLIVKEEEKQKNVLTIVNKVSKVSQRYIKGMLLDITILAILSSTGYLLLGIKHAILFGVLAAMLNIIPYVGVFIGSSLPVLMALITKDDISYAFGALGVGLFVQFIDNNFITPYVVGSSVSINPLTAILVLIASAMLWGIPGMVLCIPITGMVKVVCDHVESLKPYGFLIGEEVDFRHRDSFQKRIRNTIRGRMDRHKDDTTKS